MTFTFFVSNAWLKCLKVAKSNKNVINDVRDGGDSEDGGEAGCEDGGE